MQKKLVPVSDQVDVRGEGLERRYPFSVTMAKSI